MTGTSGRDQLLLVKEALDKMLRETARSNFGPQYIATAKRTLDLALETGRFAHAVDAAPIHHLFLANVVSAARR